MKTILIGFVVVVAALVVGVGASLGAATVVSRVAAYRLVGAAAQGQSFRMNRQDFNRMGPGMRRNGMHGWQKNQPGAGPGFQNQEPFGDQNGQKWGPGHGMPGQCWRGGQNGPYGPNGQNNQNGENDRCLNMDPDDCGMGSGGRMWPR